MPKTTSAVKENISELDQASIVCPYGKLLETLGKAHTLEIIYGLTISSPMRFTRIQKDLDLQPKTLTARMKELVKLGLVVRKSHNEIPPRVDYELTQKGKDLDIMFQALNAWARKYHYIEQPRRKKTKTRSELRHIRVP